MEEIILNQYFAGIDIGSTMTKAVIMNGAVLPRSLVLPVPSTGS